MPTDITKLQFSLDIDGRRAKSAIAAMEASFKRGLGRVGDAADDANVLLKGLQDTAKEFGVEYSKGLMLSQKQLVALTRKQEDLLSSIENVRTVMKSASAAEKAGFKAQIEGLEEKLALIKEIRANQKGVDFGTAFNEAIETSAKEFRNEVEDAFKGFIGFDRRKMTKEVGSSLSDAMAGLGSKSFSGMAKGIGGALGGVGKGAVGKLAKMGGADSAMAGLAGTLAKLGPVLAMSAGAIMAIVKLFVDAEAQAKDFNKELLATASTGGFLAKQAGNAEMAFTDLQQTLNSIRNAAFDAGENLRWGIQAKDHAAVLNVLTQEGVTLDRIQSEARDAGKEVGAFSADMVHVAVAFSKNFGVSLNDIAQFQGEMMTELGTRATDIAGSFGMIHQAASDAGMAENKFFQIIRSISTDLSLYNNRLEDAAHLLKLVGKAMSPRNAQKFMQETMQGMKNMSRTEKLKLSLLAGGKKTADVLTKDFESKRKAYAKQLQSAGVQGTIDDIAADIEKGGEALEKRIGNVDVGSDLQEALTQYGIDKQRASKGTFGQATALGNVGAGGMLDLYTSALAKFGGGKKLSEGAGSIGMEMMAEQLGISQERLDAMIKVEKSVDQQRKLLKKQAQKEGKSADDLKQIDEMGTQDIINSMSDDAKKSLDEAKNVESFAKRQVDLTSSLLDKIDTIMQFLLNQVYEVLSGIYDVVVDSFFGKDEQRARRDALRVAGRDTGLVSAAQQQGDLRNNLAKVIQTNLLKGFKATEDTVAAAKKNLEGAKTPEAKKAAQEALDAAEKTKRQGVQDVLGRMDANKLYEAMDMAGVNRAAMGQATGGLKYDAQGKLTQDSMIGLQNFLDSTGKLGTVMDKAVLTFGAKDVASFRSNQFYQQGLGEKGAAQPPAPLTAAGATPVPGAATPSAAIAPPPSKEKPATVEQQAQTVAAVESVADGQKRLGFDKSNVKNTFQPAIENGTLEAMRTALFEYYMYSGLDRGAVAQGLKAGTFNATNLGKQVVQNSTATGTVMVPTANADGGVVAKPPSGEFFASVAPGETIVPRGGSTQGGGGSVNITLNVNGIGGQDLARHLQNKVNEGIYEYKRREKFH